jgi:acyl-CoA reductase-like NAD-dependent aldehyde dehydrogenase
MEVRDKIYINGAWVCPAGPGILEVIDSGTEEVLATIPEGNAGDAGQAGKAPNRPVPVTACTGKASPQTKAADQRKRRPPRYFRSWRAMTTRWIWLVPS